MTTMHFGDHAETVVTREEFPLAAARAALAGERLAVLGYGVQGPGQALNLRDNGFDVIVGQRPGTASHARAIADGFVPGETLLDLDEACAAASVIMVLLSDAGQIAAWPSIRAALEPGKCLYFSHGFAVTFAEQTGVVPPAEVDVVLVAPKGSGTSLRRQFLAGRGINASFAIEQDATGRARERAIALGMAIGSGYLFETSFRHEVLSDLTGERGILMGALAGLMEAQYAVLRRHGHSPSEAFNETVEELSESLMPLVGENGMAWMFANTSVTAQRGALDWRHEFRDATAPVFAQLYERVASGAEAARVIAAGRDPDYRATLEAELAEVAGSELWRVGEAVRRLRPSG